MKRPVLSHQKVKLTEVPKKPLKSWIESASDKNAKEEDLFERKLSSNQKCCLRRVRGTRIEPTRILARQGRF